MNESIQTSSERPAKRVRQACEPCRRKKAKCPGEQPACSLCTRLHQECTYANERRRSPANGVSPDFRQATAAPGLDAPSMAARLECLEAKITQVLAAIDRPAARQPPVDQASDSSVPLPAWDKVLILAEEYLQYCDCQPLPLFYRDDFLSTLAQRDVEVIYAIISLSVRFSEPTIRASGEAIASTHDYAETARSLVMRRISQGPIELPTLQCLCLLSLVDFTNGNTHRSSIHSSLAMNFARCANLGFEPHAQLSPRHREERRRCFWSICLLKRLHGEEFNILDLPDGGSPSYPASAPRPPLPFDLPSGTSERRSTDLPDQGIIAYAIMLSEVFAKAARYVRLHGKPSNIPPWSSQSEYSKIITLQMDLETRMPYTHRFKPAKLHERTIAELQANRQYWGPWLLNQFLYHTSLCLLNHPLLLSLCLRNFRSSIPEIFLQHTSDLLSSHTTWIIHFLRMFEEKSFEVSDPFLGYCAAVVATIELQLSYNENPGIRQEKRERFLTCVRFVEGLGEKWPHMTRTADRLRKLEGAVSASYQQDAGESNKSLLIDLSRFWEILEYSSNSDADSARRLFGDSLYPGSAAPMTEVSQTSPLPEPWRLNEQDNAGRNNTLARGPPVSAPAQYDLNAVMAPRPLDLANDDFSILATNFFSQGQEFLRSWDNRENVGNF